ncbi:MAG: GGDEF domain-containing protein [Planctomyces sp.]|nr:GGDEF domain-containing protein [Planctomyces sp.]
MPIDIKKYSRVPSLPTVAIEILRLFDDPNSSMDDLIKVIRKDPAIVSKLLKAANSAQYAARGEVTDPKRAVMMLGRVSVTPLVLSFSLAQQSMGTATHVEHYRKFWLRSFVQATAAEVLGSQFGSPAFRGECYTTSLLAGIGKLALLRAEQEKYVECLRRSQVEGASLCWVEQQMFGFSHSELSAELLKQLGLPSRCVQAIHTLDLSRTSDEFKDGDRSTLADVSRTADAVASLLCDESRAIAILALDDALRTLVIPSPLTSEELIDRVRDRLDATAAMFDIDLPSLPAPGDLLQDALEQLSRFASAANEQEATPATVPSELLEENGRLKRRVADLLKVSRTDSLTGAYNRAYFLTQLAERVAVHRIRRQSIGLAVIDIDHFKKINDTWGHQAGDHVLKLVSECLQKALRDSDLLARYGGEEFVILMDDATTEGLAILGERLRAKIEELPISFESNQIPVTISIGLTESQIIGEDADFARQLFAAADTGMYRAKHSGRNRFVIEAYGCQPGTGPIGKSDRVELPDQQSMALV